LERTGEQIALDWLEPPVSTIYSPRNSP
jgi:hypothetical protein